MRLEVRPCGRLCPAATRRPYSTQTERQGGLTAPSSQTYTVHGQTPTLAAFLEAEIAKAQITAVSPFEAAQKPVFGSFSAAFWPLLICFSAAYGLPRVLAAAWLL